MDPERTLADREDQRETSDQEKLKARGVTEVVYPTTDGYICAVIYNESAMAPVSLLRSESWA